MRKIVFWKREIFKRRRKSQVLIISWNKMRSEKEKSKCEKSVMDQRRRCHGMRRPKSTLSTSLTFFPTVQYCDECRCVNRSQSKYICTQMHCRHYWRDAIVPRVLTASKFPLPPVRTLRITINIKKGWTKKNLNIPFSKKHPEIINSKTHFPLILFKNTNFPRLFSDIKDKFQHWWGIWNIERHFSWHTLTKDKIMFRRIQDQGNWDSVSCQPFRMRQSQKKRKKKLLAFLRIVCFNKNVCDKFFIPIIYEWCFSTCSKIEREPTLKLFK